VWSGITASYDDTNSELLYYHLSEMFRLAPGITFYLIPVNKTKTIAQLVADTALLTAIRSIEGVNVIGIAGTPDLVTSALTNSPLLQGMVNTFATEKLLIDGVFVEGVGAASVQAITAYGDLRTLTAPNVTYVIGQDPARAGLKSAYAKHAAIGTVLGSVAVRRIHEDIGSVDIEEKPRGRKGEENYSISDTIAQRWLSAALSDGKLFSSMTIDEQKSLTAKGYMYVGKFPDYGGYYWNGCPTAVSKTSDYAYFNFNCIWNKAARIIRKTLIPRVRSKVPTNPTDGTIESTWISGCEGLLKGKLEAMIASGNIEDADVYINPAQSPGESTPLVVKGQLVVGKIVHEFDVDLGLTDKL
jgi:hypothetical protein